MLRSRPLGMTIFRCMSKIVKQKKLTKTQDIKKYQEIAAVYNLLYKELEALEVERKELKKKVRGIIDKVKMKNVLEEIVKKP